jgi:hypothetical protein
MELCSKKPLLRQFATELRRYLVRALVIECCSAVEPLERRLDAVHAGLEPAGLEDRDTTG